jgi:hypothetical protein
MHYRLTDTLIIWERQGNVRSQQIFILTGLALGYQKREHCKQIGLSGKAAGSYSESAYLRSQSECWLAYFFLSLSGQYPDSIFK